MESIVDWSVFAEAKKSAYRHSGCFPSFLANPVQGFLECLKRHLQAVLGKHLNYGRPNVLITHLFVLPMF
jgi:hypothetical protein